MLCSPTAKHALRALIYLAGREGRGPVLVKEVADAEGIPQQFLSKILNSLKNQGLLKSTRGPGGGYELKYPAQEITFRRVISAVDGPVDLPEHCILGLLDCSDEHSCALHEAWNRFREQYANGIGRVTIAEAANNIGRKRSVATETVQTLEVRQPV